MGRKRAIKIVVPGRPLRAGKCDMLEVHLRIPDSVEVVGHTALFEGRSRAAFSGHDSITNICSERLLFPIEPFLLTTVKGSHVLPSGSFRLPLPIRVPPNIPGTFTAKHGAIAYRVSIKIRLRRVNTNDEAVLETEKDVDVIGNVELDAMRKNPNLTVEKHLKKSLLGMSRLDAKIQFEVEKNAFMIGEHILVTGSVLNQHTTNIIKHISIELRQKVVYHCGEAKKTDYRMITKLICGSVSPNETFPLHHSVQIPMDCYPSLAYDKHPVEVSYVMILLAAGHFELEIPVNIANHVGNISRRSIQWPDDKSSVYYCTPPSESSEDVPPTEGPPPYSEPQNRPYFIPIHMLKTPQRPFMPMFGGFHDFPPKYPSDTGPRFLKIEEIVD